MTNGSETTALERLLRPLSQHLTLELARALVHLQADVETQARYDELADRRTEGQLAAPPTQSKNRLQGSIACASRSRFAGKRVD
jgi:hypothetical protein